MVYDAHSRGKFTVQVLLSGLKDCDLGLEVKFLILLQSGALGDNVVSDHTAFLRLAVLVLADLTLIAVFLLLNEDGCVRLHRAVEISRKLREGNFAAEIKVHREENVLEFAICKADLHFLKDSAKLKHIKLQVLIQV